MKQQQSQTVVQNTNEDDAVIILRPKQLSSQERAIDPAIRNLKTILEAVKEAEAEAKVNSTLETGEKLNNLYAALLCQAGAVVESAASAASRRTDRKVA